jgi:hypothetical protein
VIAVSLTMTLAVTLAQALHADADAPRALSSANWNAGPPSIVRADVAAAVWNGRLYVVGGYDNVGPIGPVEFAALGGDGSLGAFATSTPLALPRGAVGAAAVNGRLYVAGGNTGALDMAPINSDGTLGAWTSDANALSRMPYGQGLVASGNTLFAVGGAHVTGSAPNFDTTWFTDVSIGQVNSSSGAVTWAAGPPFTTARTHHGVAVGNGYLYILGGEGAGPAQLSDVQFAPINGGALSAWSSTTQLPTARTSVAAFVSGGFLFAVGGRSGLNQLGDVLQARILSNGALGAWIRSKTITARYLHAAAVNSGYAYVVDGFTNAYASKVEWKKLETPGPAKALSVDALPAAMTTAQCAPVTVSLRDQGSQATWSDTSFQVSLATGRGPAGGAVGARFFSNTDCTGDAVTGVAFGAGVDQLVFGVQPTEADNNLQVLLSASGLTDAASTFIKVTLAPQPALADDPHGINGWGCATGGAGPLGALSGLWVLAARRRRRERHGVLL